MKPIASLLLCLTAASTFADDPAPPEYESGDPRAFSLDELRALRDTLLRVTIPRTDGVSRPEDQMRGPFEGRNAPRHQARDIRQRDCRRTDHAGHQPAG